LKKKSLDRTVAHKVGFGNNWTDQSSFKLAQFGQLAKGHVQLPGQKNKTRGRVIWLNPGQLQKMLQLIFPAHNSIRNRLPWKVASLPKTIGYEKESTTRSIGYFSHIFNLLCRGGTRKHQL